MLNENELNVKLMLTELRNINMENTNLMFYSGDLLKRKYRFQTTQDFQEENWMIKDSY